MPKKGYIQTEEHKRKISNSLKLKWEDKEFMDKIRTKKEIKEILYKRYISIFSN